MSEETKNNHTDEEIEDENEEGSENAGKVEGTNHNDSSNNESDDKSGGKDSKNKTFTQSQVTRMMTREKNQGRNAAYKELGIDPKDTKMINMFKAFVESQKSDEEKAAEKESENQTKINEAEQRALVAEAKAEAMLLGVKSQYVEDIVTLALSRMTEDADLKTIIGEFKTKYPTWFGESDDAEGKNKGNDKIGQKGTGSSIKNSDKSKNGDESKGIGARLAAQRKAGNKKSNYWGNK